MTTQNSSCFTSRVWHRFPFPPVDVAVKTGVFPPPTEIYYDGISSASILAIVNITFYIFCLKNRWYRMETRSEPLTTSAPKFIKFASCCLEKLICTSTRPVKVIMVGVARHSHKFREDLRILDLKKEHEESIQLLVSQVVVLVRFLLG